ncbi:methyl-accepting chemotaxis protein [Falsiroseomonas sp. E2-1-a20]|uniref:methyl-accepting chemotaxis protein n=1 Tax=Falsiroseomonas sp. E2-1-a20 TaxID=3239300 RepID=UPI003F3BECB5
MPSHALSAALAARIVGARAAGLSVLLATPAFALPALAVTAALGGAGLALAVAITDMMLPGLLIGLPLSLLVLLLLVAQQRASRMLDAAVDAALPGLEHVGPRQALPAGSLRRAAMLCSAMPALTADLLQLRAERLDRGGEEARSDAIRRMVDVIEQETDAAVDEINGSARELEEIADTLERATVRAAHEATKAQGETERSAAGSDEAAAGTTRIVEAIRESSSQMALVAETTRQVVVASDAARTTFGDLRRQAEEIDDVTRMIGLIARQTNLLALNATIEAARAGAAGKGFAVVAGEVKTLAAQTAKASSEIAERLASVQSGTANALHAMDSVHAGMDALDTITGRMTEMLQNQAGVVGEVASAVREASEAATGASLRVAAAVQEIEDNRMSVGMIHGASGQVTASLATLQSRIIGLVRSNLPDADRRRDPRHAVDLAARLTLGASTTEGRLKDISNKGARFSPEPEAPEGTEGMLDLTGMPAQRVRLLGKDSEARLSFLFRNAAEEADMAAAIRRLLLRQAA